MDNPPSDLEQTETYGPARYIPLLVVIAAVITLALIPLKIISQGFMPPDDALRSVGKVLSGKAWDEILVLREGVTIDHNAGWHAILGAARSLTGWGGEGLLTFSVILLAFLFLLSPLAFIRRSDAWIAAMLAAIAAYPHFVFRLCLGRPYIFVMAVVMVIMLMWVKGPDRPGKLQLALTTLLLGVAAWIHGGWYMYWLPAAAFFAVQRWRQGFLMTACWLAGSFLGGLFTGRPVYFLVEQFKVLLSCFSYHSVQRMLVTEFQPSDGFYGVISLVGFILLALAVTGQFRKDTLRDPVLALAAITWVLGFMVKRFWLDWAMPALLVWMALQFEVLFNRYVHRESLSRLFASGLMCVGLYFAMTSDLSGRWTNNLTREYLTTDNPEWTEWLPEEGGVVYSDNMSVFYETFYHNPHAPWRYLLGFEATFMPQDDMEIFRKIQWNFGTPEAYQPWVEKMRPIDRMILRRSKGAKPEIEGLEWHYAATETWIGRKPRPDAAPDAPAQ